MKIAVYAIAKNEEKNIWDWVQSCQDADYVLFADTGSTDKSHEVLSTCYGVVTLGININPWRFEDARNAALAYIPNDIDVCIALDLDERLTEGWRKKIEKAYTDLPILDRIRYNYVWSHTPDGKPGLTYFGDKIHTRKNFRWVHPVHEVLKKDLRAGPEIQSFITDTLIEHYPDNSKSRSSYLDLLALSVQENPYDDRNAHYYARDLMFAGRYQEAIDEFKRHLSLQSATWKDERATSYRYIGDCLWALGAYEEAGGWFKGSITEAPHLREGYTSLAQSYRSMKDYKRVLETVQRALAIKTRPNTYICQESSWNGWLEQMEKEALENLSGKSSST